jgi:ornithine cyclodeaminase/alanine dehydrogenase-like protein (mu-crystallin family)
MTLPEIDAGTLRRVLPMEAAIDALEAAFGSGPLPEAPTRLRVGTRWGDLLAMPAAGDGGAGVKLVTVNPGNPDRGLPLIHAVYVLFKAGSLEPAALVDGAALTALRTAAVSGLATRHLALPDAGRLVIFGAGVQAGTHLEAMCAVRPVRSVVVVGRTPTHAERLARAARDLGLEARVGEPGDVRDADVVCTCTTSPGPLFDGGWLRPGAHVNAVGAYTPTTRELDDETIRRSRVAVETRDAVFDEAGDLLQPIAAGVIGADHVVADLAEVVGGAAVRRSPEDVTVFKSVGVAFEDLVVAQAAAGALAVEGAG